MSTTPTLTLLHLPFELLGPIIISIVLESSAQALKLRKTCKSFRDIIHRAVPLLAAMDQIVQVLDGARSVHAEGWWDGDVDREIMRFPWREEHLESEEMQVVDTDGKVAGDDAVQVFEPKNTKEHDTTESESYSTDMSEIFLRFRTMTSFIDLNQILRGHVAWLSLKHRAEHSPHELKLHRSAKQRWFGGRRTAPGPPDIINALLPNLQFTEHLTDNRGYDKRRPTPALDRKATGSLSLLNGKMHFLMCMNADGGFRAEDANFSFRGTLVVGIEGEELAEAFRIPSHSWAIVGAIKYDLFGKFEVSQEFCENFRNVVVSAQHRRQVFDKRHYGRLLYPPYDRLYCFFRKGDNTSLAYGRSTVRAMGLSNGSQGRINAPPSSRPHNPANPAHLHLSKLHL